MLHNIQSGTQTVTYLFNDSKLKTRRVDYGNPDKNF
jgi:hypothetical protein